MKNIIYTMLVLLSALSVHSQELLKDTLINNNIIELLPNGDYEYLPFENKYNINGDEFKDLIIKWRKKNLPEGDNQKYSVFFAVNDTMYILKKTFHNLAPLHFEKYDEYYKTGNEFLDSIKETYHGWYPCKGIDFKDSLVIIDYWYEPYYYYRNIYMYSRKMDNWYLEKKVLFERTTENKQIKNYDMEKYKNLLEDFSY